MANVVELHEKTHSNINIAGDQEELNDNPIEEVRLTVPITDDPTEPSLTFRTWVLGILSCVILAFVNQFFDLRTNNLSIGSVTSQIVVLPLGRFMAATLPTKTYRVPLTGWSFSLNPGPFNLKEHVLITILAGCGTGGVYAVYIVTILKAFYHRKLNATAAMLLAQSTQLLGYGWAGIFRKILVDSPYMWWPANLVQVSLFRALHEKETRKKGGFTRLQFFLMVFVASFAYYIVPGYLFPSLSNLSIVCWIWTKSITAQQIGSGRNGLGIGSFGLDWSTVAGFLGSPLATPLFAIVNTLVGFGLVMYVVLPITYWSNFRDAKKFPIFTSHTYDVNGTSYDITRILNEEGFDINLKAYDSYSKLYLSIFFAFGYGLSFATLAATIMHVALYDGKTIWTLWKSAKSASKQQFNDVHNRLMKKNYEQVPEWWFMVVLAVSIALALVACEGFGKQIQLPWWALLLACFIAFFFTLPIGIIQATTNTQVGLNVITELIIGYMYPGKPVANVAFKTYGYISMSQALSFVGDFKLGHYMKIPPKAMFLVQLVGTVIASTVYFGTAWYLLSSIKGVCDSSVLPEGSPWTCPGGEVFYNASIIWGVIGPLRMFGKLGVYWEQNYWFLVGLLAPIPGYFLSLKYPENKWIKQIHIPLILGATAGMPPTRAVHYIMWGLVGILFNYYIYRNYKAWWAKYNYILSAALSAGIAFMGILLFFSLQSQNIGGPQWWGLDASDHCKLATCPTAPGISAEGCSP